MTNNDFSSTLENIDNLPSIPAIVFDIISTIKTEPGNNYKLAKIIAKDQGVTTKLISVINSPLYGFNREITSLELAIMLLGTKEIESIVTAISLSDSLKIKSTNEFNYLKYWQHCTLVGLTARDLVRKFGYPEYSGEAFLGGILHDIGIQLIVKFFKEEYHEIVNKVNQGTTFDVAEKDVLGLSHTDVGKILGEKWNLPDGLKTVLEFHHKPSQAAQNQIVVSSIHTADLMTQVYNIGSVPWDNGFQFDEGIIKILEFDSEELFNNFVADYEENLKDAFESAVF